MKISNLQIEDKKERFIDDCLKKSLVPTKSLVNKYLNEEFKDIYFGTPLFKPFNIKKYSTSNSDKWNNNFLNLDTDLRLLYKSFSKLNENVLNCEELYLNEKELLFNKLDKINLMIENFNYHLKSNENIFSHVQVFDSMYNCELDGDSKRNLPSTTSFVDLVSKTIKNEKKPSVQSKINLSKSNIEINTNKVKPNFINGDIKSILNDEANDFCFISYNIEDKVKDISNDIIIHIKLNSPKVFNSVSMECVSPTKYNATLSLSKDDVNYDDVYTLNNNSYCEWMFDLTEVSSLRITIEKTTIDFSNITERIYYYVLKNISCYNDRFVKESVYVSNPITVNSIIDNVTLVPNEVILNETVIDYFVGIDNGTSAIEWKQLNSDEEISLGLFRKREKILNNSLDEYGVNVGNGCYCLYKLPNGYSVNQLTLLYGYQMWQVETLNIPESEDPMKYTPDINDYTDYYVQRKSLIDTEEYKFSIRNKRSHIFTQYVYCDKDYYVRNKQFKKFGNNLKFNHSVYVNNIKVNCIDDMYNFTLKKGINCVYIMLYVCSENSNDFSEIHHNFNLKEYSFNVFAGKPLKRISNKEIRYDSLSSNSKYYAIDNNMIVVKENMSMINENIIIPNSKSDINYKNHSRYLIIYKQLNENKKNLVSLDTNTTVLRVMANLKSNNSAYSPQINNFRILSR